MRQKRAFVVSSRLEATGWGHGRWFAEIVQYGDDEGKLTEAVEADQAAGASRDLHQARVLAAIVDRKYQYTKVGMWLLGIGLVVAGLAALPSV